MKPKSMEEDTDTGAVILCALRYCVGRRTYMPSLIIDWAIRHWQQIPINDRNTIYRDIKTEIESGRDLGDDCDVKSWRTFLEYIEAQNTIKNF